MPAYTCKCEDETYKNNCSNECDLCNFGHTTDEFCTCFDCDDIEEQPNKHFVQIIDIHEDSIYLLRGDYEKDPYDFVDGTTMEIRHLLLPVCPRCRVQPATERVYACGKCNAEVTADVITELTHLGDE